MNYLEIEKDKFSIQRFGIVIGSSFSTLYWKINLGKTAEPVKANIVNWMSNKNDDNNNKDSWGLRKLVFARPEALK